MKITLAQIKYKTGDFKFNFENVIEAAKQLGSQAAKEEGKRARGQEGRLVNESSLSEISQDQQTDKNFSTLQPFNLSTSTHPHPNPLPQGEGACDNSLSTLQPFNPSTSLIVFPQADIEEIGGKDLILDENVRKSQIEFYQKIADENLPQNIIIGGFFDIEGKKVFVSDTFIEDIDCDLYILAKNRYYAMNTYKDFVNNIETHTDFVYVNSIGLKDADVFMGGSFAKNSDNEIVLQMPICKEDIDTVDFSRSIEFVEDDLEKQIIDVTTFALKEYCENTGFKKVVLGLSGGIDSALTAVLAVRALGRENVMGIMMPSMFSSKGSVDDSVKLAENLGINS